MQKCREGKVRENIRIIRFRSKKLLTVVCNCYEYPVLLECSAVVHCKKVMNIWCWILCSGALNKVTVGILEVRMELRPMLSRPVDSDVLTTQLSLERANKAQRERTFITYAKQWWEQYLQIRSAHSERIVKIFARVSIVYFVFILRFVFSFKYNCFDARHVTSD